jgi:toxin ParE1/3/4
VEAATDWMLEQAGETVALQFLDTLERAYKHIMRNPATGSLKWGVKLDIPELRSWPLKRFPYVIYCMDRPPHIEVVRVLRSGREISADSLPIASSS